MASQGIVFDLCRSRLYLSINLIDRSTNQQVFILILSAFLLGINTWGSVLMRQEFNPLWFIPTSTYLSQYFSVIENQYPENGQLASIYIQTTDLSRNLDQLEALIDTVRNETQIVSQVDDWFTGFKDFTNKRHGIGKPNSISKLV